MTQLNPAIAAVPSPMVQNLLRAMEGQLGESITNVWQYFYAADFTSIAQNGSANASIAIDAGSHFVAEHILFSANFDSSSTPTGAAALQKLYRDPETAIVSLTSAHLGMVTIDINTSDRPWMNRPCRADLITGEPGKLAIGIPPFYVAPRDTIDITVAQTLPALAGVAAPAINAQLVFAGYKFRTIRHR